MEATLLDDFKCARSQSFSFIVFAVFIVVVVSMVLVGCSTRQVVDSLEGSTEQRLVTHSINRVISELPAQPLSKLEGKKLFMDSHFIKTHPFLDYASARFRAEIDHRHNVMWVTSKGDADYYLDVFFTSLGTNQDSFGLSIPLPIQNEGGGVASIEVLSLQMFHGISELYFYLTDLNEHSVDYVGKRKAQVRTDTLATPIISFPISTLD